MVESARVSDIESYLRSRPSGASHWHEAVERHENVIWRRL